MPKWLFMTLFIVSSLQYFKKKFEDFDVPFDIHVNGILVDDLPVHCSTTHCWCYHPVSETEVTQRMAYKPGFFNVLLCKELLRMNPEPMNMTFKGTEIQKENENLFKHNIITVTPVALKTVTVAPCTPKLLCTLREPVSPKLNNNRTEIILQNLMRILFDIAVTLLIIVYLLNL